MKISALLLASLLSSACWAQGAAGTTGTGTATDTTGSGSTTTTGPGTNDTMNPNGPTNSGSSVYGNPSDSRSPGQAPSQSQPITTPNPAVPATGSGNSSRPWGH